MSVKKYHVNPSTGNPGACSAEEGNCPFGSDAPHFGSREEAREAYEVRNDRATHRAEKKATKTAPSVSMLLNASFENGRELRGALRLLNHRNYAQAKALYGKVADQSVIEAVKEAHRTEESVASLQENLTKASTRMARARTEEQRAGYGRAVALATANLTEAVERYDDAKAVLETLKGSYVRHLAIHNNALKSLENLARSEAAVERPEGIKRRVEKLQAERKGLESVSPIASLVTGETTMDRMVEGAEAYGNSYYLEAAVRHREAYLEERVLLEQRDALEDALQNAEDATEQETVQSELSKVNEGIHRLQPTLTAFKSRLELFRDEVRDRAIHERDLTRELNALLELERKTR